MNVSENNEIKRIFSKVPEVTIYFWIIKILCTTVGETAADYINMSLGLGLSGTSLVMGIFLAIALVFQYRAPRYIPGIYWLTVVLISIFGTLVTDNLTDKMHVPLEISTIIFCVALSATFAIWYSSERTLSIHSIFTVRRESFYWLAILFTFALGTAAGDLMAESLGLGYLVTGLIVCSVVAVVSAAWQMGLDSVLSFWIVYIMTRPLGASLGDYLSQPHEYGGLGFGPTVTSIIFLSAILITVVFLSITKRDMIASKNSSVVEEQKSRKVFIQVAIVLFIMLAASWGGYYWRHARLLDVAKLEKTATANSANAGFAPVNMDIRPLGDLSSFKKIATDTLALVDSGKLAGAKIRIADLELTWDNNEAKIKPMNSEKWTEMDKVIDDVLRKLRAFHQDSAACHSSLTTLVSVIDQLDPLVRKSSVSGSNMK